MARISDELTVVRRIDIIEACRTLYRTKSFREITIKDIGDITPFTRTSIYNYFQTKEEIFLAMHCQEYEFWCEELQSILDANDRMCVKDFSDALARSLEHRPLLLRLMAMNHFDMEEKSRPEQLYEFKRAFGEAINLIRVCLKKFFPDMSEARRGHFLYIFFPFLFGIYPYTAVTEKQRTAMKEAGIEFEVHSVYAIAQKCIHALLI